MTNAEIIFNNRVFLMEQGVIKGIEGTSITFKDEDGERQVMMPEEIKTFDAWKREGYIVCKGEHSVARFQIWMPKKGNKKKEADADADKEGTGEDAEMKAKGFYKKVAFFFTMDQVKQMERKEG